MELKHGELIGSLLRCFFLVWLRERERERERERVCCKIQIVVVGGGGVVGVL
jgi:hypothetical protein